MREIKYFFEKVSKGAINKDDLISIGAAICCVISISFGGIFFVISMMAFAECVQTVIINYFLIH